MVEDGIYLKSKPFFKMVKEILGHCTGLKRVCITHNINLTLSSGVMLPHSFISLPAGSKDNACALHLAVSLNKPKPLISKTFITSVTFNHQYTCILPEK